MNRALAVAVALAVVVLCASPAKASIVFQDNFNSENGGAGALNYASFANWTVSDGSVDLIGNGFFDFYSGNGLYVDLDGTTSDAATLTSTSLALAPGNYVLSFSLGVNGSGNNDFLLTLGSFFSETFDQSDAGGAPNFATITRSFTIGSSGNESLVFAHSGGDNFGLIIDNVVLSRDDPGVVPEPASVVSVCLLLIGVVRLLHVRRPGLPTAR